MKPRRMYPRGFTLVELVIIVGLLAILAAIVVPKYSRASDEARNSNIKSQLRMIRVAIVRFKTDHNDQLPSRATLFEQLMNRTDAEGNVDAAGPFGPYIKAAPANPYNGSRSIVAPGAGGSDDGWEYDEDTGAFNAVGYDEQTDTFAAPTL